MSERQYKTIAIVFGIFLLSNCKTPEKNDPKVIGGVLDDKNFPATVGLLTLDSTGVSESGGCTGTFIRDDLLLTAGHCFISPDRSSSHDSVRVFDSFKLSQEDQSFFFNGRSYSLSKPIEGVDIASVLPTSSSIFIHPDYLSDGANIWADLAIVSFPKGTVPQSRVAKFADQAPKQGERISIIGYGMTQREDFGPPQRMSGTNTLVAIDKMPKSDMDGVIFSDPRILNMFRIDGGIRPRKQDEPMQANGNEGDSGGPIYNSKNEIIGTTEWGGDAIFPGVEWTGIYTNLFQAENAAFVQAALAGKLGAPTPLPFQKK